jgi:hypothetical protein
MGVGAHLPKVLENKKNLLPQCIVEHLATINCLGATPYKVPSYAFT